MSKSKIEIAEINVRHVEVELQTIMEQHDEVTLKLSKDNVEQWFMSLPIVTLSDSLNFEKGNSFGIYSLKKLKEKSRLRKLFESKYEELELARNKLRLEEIKRVLRKLKKKAKNGTT